MVHEKDDRQAGQENFEMTDRLVKEDYTLRTIINTSVRKLNDIHQQISGLKEVI